MVETVSLARPCAPMIVLASLVAVPAATNGHVLDEYLQSTLVVIEPADIRLHINLTPGVEVADRILDTIDQDHDGVVSTEETMAYAALLKRDLAVQFDGRDVEIKLIAAEIPNVAELHTGHAIVQLQFSVLSGSFAAGHHRLAVDNKHFKAIGVYLFNAARPKSALIRIDKQTRSRNQSQGEVEFSYSPSASVPHLKSVLLAALTVLVVATLAVLVRQKTSATIPAR